MPRIPLRVRLLPRPPIGSWESLVDVVAGSSPVGGDDALGLTETADECLQESRGGRNVQHRLAGLLRQSVYSRLAGYEDTNDAERLADDPTMRVVVGDRGIDRPAASTNTMSRFETEVLTQDGNGEGLGRLNAEWVDGAMSRTPHRRVILANMGNPGLYIISAFPPPSLSTHM